MYLQIKYTVEATDAIRRAINMHYGRPGLASREQTKRWYVVHGFSRDDELLSAWIHEGEEGLGIEDPEAWYDAA